MLAVLEFRVTPLRTFMADFSIWVAECLFFWFLILSPKQLDWHFYLRLHDSLPKIPEEWSLAAWSIVLGEWHSILSTLISLQFSGWTSAVHKPQKEWPKTKSKLHFEYCSLHSKTQCLTFKAFMKYVFSGSQNILGHIILCLFDYNKIWQKKSIFTSKTAEQNFTFKFENTLG